MKYNNLIKIITKNLFLIKKNKIFILLNLYIF